MIDLKNYTHPENFGIGKGRFNRSDVYVLPMLGGVESNYRGSKFPKSNYRGCFIGDKTQEGYESGYIMLLYRLPFQSVDNIDMWRQFESTVLMGNDNYRGDYSVDKYHQMYIFEIPAKFKGDYDKFLQWKPSLFSIAYKDHLMKFFRIEDIAESNLYAVIYKDSKYGEARFREIERQLGCLVPRELENSSIPYWSIEYFGEEFKHKAIFEKVKDGTEDNGI